MDLPRGPKVVEKLRWQEMVDSRSRTDGDCALWLSDVGSFIHVAHLATTGV
jgi:hypothetical protein